ncbi:hypothetical protein Drorol1_Dr00025546 [Drosera rotundifolia]
MGTAAEARGGRSSARREEEEEKEEKEEERERERRELKRKGRKECRLWRGKRANLDRSQEEDPTADVRSNKVVEFVQVAEFLQVAQFDGTILMLPCSTL